MTDETIKAFNLWLLANPTYFPGDKIYLESNPDPVFVRNYIEIAVYIEPTHPSILT